jgi:hypothetical protein
MKRLERGPEEAHEHRLPWRHRYDQAVDDPEAARCQVRERLDEEALAELGRKHLSHFHIPAIPIPGIGTLEKKLIFYVCDHTGAPNPFHTLERVTGDCVALQAAEHVWADVYRDILAVSDALRASGAPLRENWSGLEAERFATALDAYLEGLDALAGSVRTTWECIRAIRSEAQLAEGTIQMLINIMIGSLGGMLVAELMTAGTVTPVAAAQVQVELAYVAKKIAFIGGKLNMVQSDICKVLDAVHGFKRVEAMRFVFDVAPGVTSLL